MANTTNSDSRLACPRCGKTHWHAPRAYYMGGPDMQRCRACGFSVRTTEDPTPGLVTMPGIRTSTVVLDTNGKLTRIRYSGYKGTHSGQFKSRKPSESLAS